MKDNGFAFFVMNWQLAVSVLSQHLQVLYFYMRDAWLCHGDVRAQQGWARQRFLGWHGRARAARACPTTPARSGAAGWHWGNPSFGHLPGAEARSGCGPMGGPGLVGPMAEQGELGTGPAVA